MNELILFTGGFPFGMSETFLETEIAFLAKGFDKVHIVAINPNSDKCRELPSNCSVEKLHIPVGKMEKALSLRFLFSGLFWKEIKVIRKTYCMPLSLGVIRTMLISLHRARFVQRHIEKNIPYKKQVFYSYWCDDAAIGLALLKKNNAEIKAVTRMHGWDVYFDVHPLNYLPYRHFVSAHLDILFPISEKGKSYIESNWKINQIQKVKVARLGVKEQKLLVPNDEFIVVSCSNLIPLKRVDLIIESLALIANEKIKWVHFGNGPERSKLEQLAKVTLEGKEISYEFKGHITNAELLEWYELNRPSLFINVSTSEGIPVSIMEAMSFGIPVLATDVGGTRELVNNQNGFLIDSQVSAQDIASRIVQFKNLAQDERSMMIHQAFDTWKTTYNSETNYENFVKSLLSLH